MPGTTITVTAEDGTPVAAGTIGRIWLDHPAHGSRGPVDTGDLGRLDNSGALVMAGRRDEMVNLNGSVISFAFRCAYQDIPGGNDRQRRGGPVPPIQGCPG